jgi:hypothetical protein
MYSKVFILFAILQTVASCHTSKIGNTIHFYDFQNSYLSHFSLCIEIKKTLSNEYKYKIELSCSITFQSYLNIKKRFIS